MVLSAIKDILSSSGTRSFGGLSRQEYQILEDLYEKYGKQPKQGLDWQNGAYYNENDDSKTGIHLSAEIGLKNETTLSGGYYFQDKDFEWGEDSWFIGHLNGDLGNHFSYGYTIQGGIVRSPRENLGPYYPYYEGYHDDEYPDELNTLVTTYSQPLTYFPYTYKKGWSKAVWSVKEIDNSSHLGWPKDVSIGYSMEPELGGTFINDHIRLRIGRLDREWGAMATGSSLILNQSAMPFLAFDGTAELFSWLSLSTITGILEFDYSRKNPETVQNAYSATMMELNHQYFHADFGSIALWPKRFELGYSFPDVFNFLSQGGSGDFDNVSAFINLKGRYPGIGDLWFSFFLDEINPEKKLFELDRSMYAYQGGAKVNLPWLPFASLTLSYTKIEPYTYSHQRIQVPWYGEAWMETAYVNNGMGIGYYLPPNSDEVRLRFETMPAMAAQLHFQYQMIRHGADHGPHSVDGSSYLSQLDPSSRSEKLVLRKYFLQDGAYQWQHILKVGGTYSLAGKNIPVEFFGEAGVIFSYYTDIEDGKANTGSAYTYSVIDTEAYPKTTGIILTLGFRIWP